MRNTGDNDSGREETLVRVHENTGCEGVVVELRPEEYDVPSERDMEMLSLDEARELHRQLSKYLADQDPNEFVELVADELMPLMAPEDVHCEFSDQVDGAQGALRFAADHEPAVDLPVGGFNE